MVLVDSSTSGDDVISIKEEEIPAEKLEAARKWQLPDAFYLYEDRPACKGCLGCLTDEFDFSTIGSDKTVKIPQKTGKYFGLDGSVILLVWFKEFINCETHAKPLPENIGIY